MTLRKVYVAGYDDDDAEVLAIAGSSSGSSPVSRSKHEFMKMAVSSQSSGGKMDRIRRRLRIAVANKYALTSWTPRQSINDVIKLSILLYLFISVPFRIGFLYDPFGEIDSGYNRWTWRLSVLYPLDVIADIAGAVEFVKVYRLWRNAISYEEEINGLEKDIKLKRDAEGQKHDKTKWTLASIRRTLEIRDEGESGMHTHKHFGRTWELALEIVALLPLEIFPLVSRQFNALHLVRFNKLCRVYKLRRCFSRLSSIYSHRPWVQHLSSAGFNSLVRTIAFCAASCHLAACGYMFIAHLQCGISFDACNPNVETSWVIRDQLIGASISRKYGRTLYWASRTLVLLGYSDVTPVSNAETVYAIFVQLLGALFSSSILANFLFIFRFRNAKYSAYSAHVDNARDYMRSKGIPRSIRRRVIAYFNYSWSSHRSLDGEEAQRMLPKHLKSKVVATLKTSRLKQICFLAKESIEFINLLVLVVERRVYSPADVIVEPKITTQMFFVIRGSAMVSSANGSLKRKSTFFKEYQAGDYFAEICLLSPEKSEEKIVAKTFCELYVLDKSKFDSVVTQFYRGMEASVVSQMHDVLDKYYMQQRKTQKLLGQAVNDADSTRKTSRRMSIGMYRPGAKVNVHWSHPDSSFRTLWDTLRLAGTIYVAFEVPYQTVFIAMAEGEHVFTKEPVVGLRYLCSFMVEVFFGVDIILRSRYLGYLDPIVMLNIVDPTLIFAAYREHGFFLDVFAWLPIGLVLESGAMREYFWFLRFPRLLRLRFLPSLVSDLSESYSISSKLQLIGSLLLAVTLLLHIVGCVWFEMAWIPHTAQAYRSDNSLALSLELSTSECLRQATHFENCSWVKFDCYINVGTSFPVENKAAIYNIDFGYVRAVYWAVATLTAVGYGDIVAFSTAETYFAAVWIFVGGIINFGVVGAMSSIISNMMTTRRQHLELLNTLNTAMGKMAISERLSAEIRRFYNNHFTGRQVAYESQLLANLPDRLCYQISSLLHSTAAKNVALFDSASLSFLDEVTGKFRHRSYENGETICIEGDVCREFFVLLKSSKVDVFYRSRKVPVLGLHDGDSYGVCEFLLRRSFSATLVAASTVHASVMTREHFSVIQRKFEDDLRDMRLEADVIWSEQQQIFRRTARNLECLKLKPHVLLTPSFFYQRDIAAGNTKILTRDAYATRTMFTNIWTTGITLWNVYNALFIVFRVGFHSHLHFSSSLNTAVWVTDLCGDFYIAVDIYLRLYYFGSPEVGFDNLIHRSYVDKVYRRTEFKWDVLASLPLYVPTRSDSLIVNLCRMPRLIRCLELWVYLDEVIVQVQQHFASRNVSAVLGPAKLVIILVLVAHFVGCIFVWISDDECVDNDNCWLQNDHLLHAYQHTLPILYAKTFYWAITTLLLVGSSEIVPRSVAGTLWAVLTCLACTFAMGYIVGEISELILDFGKETKKYKNRVTAFDTFATSHDIPEVLRERVEFFFRAQFERTQGRGLNHLVHELSANLRLKLTMEIYGCSLARLPIRPFLSTSQVNNLALRLHAELFIPGDDVLLEGTTGNHLCALRKGVAAAFWSKCVASVAVILEGALLGEVAFFLPNQRRLVTVRAISSCEVLRISKRDWEELWTPGGDPSDNQEQKYALHSIVDWVNNRIQRYQRQSLRIANKVKRQLLSRQETKSAPPVLDVLSSNSINFRTVSKSSQSALGSIPTPESVMLDSKANFLLAKADYFTQQYQAAQVATALSRKSIVTSMTRNVKSAVTSAKKRVNIRENAVASPSHSSTKDIGLDQFILDVNPISKHLRVTFKDEYLRRLENECWQRFRLMTLLQHNVHKMLQALVPHTLTQSNASSGRLQPKFNLMRKKSVHLERMQAVRLGELGKQKRGSDLMARNPRKTSLKQQARVNKPGLLLPLQTRASSIGKKSSKSKRRFTSAVGRVITKQLVNAVLTFKTKTAIEPETMGMRRCRSLPIFGDKFFDNMHDELENKALTDTRLAGGADIDFEILQRCQRPKYEAQIGLYQRYRDWNQLDGRSKLGALRSSFQRSSSSIMGSFRRSGSKTSSGKLETGTLRLLGQDLKLNDKKVKAFIKLLKRLGKLWSTTMLVVALYYVIVTPFKVCFAHELIYLHNSNLNKWAGFEGFLDVLCFIDIVYKIRIASHSSEAASHSRRQRLLNIFTASPGLKLDVLAILPLELLLLGRVSIEQEPVINSNGWATRWFLRVNRLLFVWRVDHLVEELLQYVIYDCNVDMSESLISFLRALASYLAMGHFIACIWFAASAYGLRQFGVSWLSTSGMLTFIGPAEVPNDFLEHVSLGRKYLRSLYFSMECITTLFYGDILSMNNIELLVEIGITLWAIYIYGALVGAQGELLDSNTRREARFEQQLMELQLYLEQHKLPKPLKRQIKAYYGHMWHRSRGESDFAVINGVSQALYEDVVLATLQDFVVRVEVFRSLGEPFLRALLVYLRYVVCSEGESVVEAGDVDRCMYFIAQGRVLVKLETTESPRERGEFFGELSLLYGISRLETCIAQTFTELYRLDHEPYERLLREFPEYRSRNKVAWTAQAAASFDHSVMGNDLKRHGDSDGIEMELPNSFVYTSTMEMLAQLQELSALEAKDLVLKARIGGCKHIQKQRGERRRSRRKRSSLTLAIVPIEINEDNDIEDDFVHYHYEAPLLQIESHDQDPLGLYS